MLATLSGFPASNLGVVDHGRAWFQRSDRKGRVNTLRICMVGNLVTELTYIFVYSHLRDHKGAYWFLLTSPLVEGLLGGMQKLFTGFCSFPEAHHRSECSLREYSCLHRGLYGCPASVKGFLDLFGVGVHRHGHRACLRWSLDPSVGRSPDGLLLCVYVTPVLRIYGLVLLT